MEENEKIEIKKSKWDKFFVGIIIFSVILIIGCAGYLINSYRLLKKYDVDSFMLTKFEIPTFNSAVRPMKKLVSASEKNDVITLKYDIKKISLNDVYAYLEKLSLKGYTIINLEDLYMRVVKLDDDIQIRIKVGSNHLVFEYNIGIDYDEEKSIKKDDEKEDKTNDNKSNLDEQEKAKIE